MSLYTLNYRKDHRKDRVTTMYKVPKCRQNNEDIASAASLVEVADKIEPDVGTGELEAVGVIPP